MEHAAEVARVYYERTGPATFVLGWDSGWQPVLRGELDPDGTARAFPEWPGRLVALVVRLGVIALVFLLAGWGNVWGRFGGWSLPPAVILVALGAVLAYEWVRVARYAALVRRTFERAR